MSHGALTPEAQAERLILNLRGHRVIIDADLAALYGVTTKALNQAIKRNRGRFPDDFVFQLTAVEKAQVVTNCDHLQKLKFSKTAPYAFTEHGVIMAANLLQSQRAIDVSIQVVRVFVRLRVMAASHVELARKLHDLEKKYDAQFKTIFEAVRQLMTPQPDPPKERIGFVVPRRPSTKRG